MPTGSELVALWLAAARYDFILRIDTTNRYPIRVTRPGRLPIQEEYFRTAGEALDYMRPEDRR